MGVIIRQSVKSAFWSYLGIAVGYVNVGIIMPQFFDTAQVGLVQLFASVSLIFAQFGTLGFTSVINRLFPRFRDPGKAHNGFLFLALATAITGFFLTAGGFVLLKPWIVETNIDRSPLLVSYLWLMLPLVFMRLLYSLLDNYNKMLYDTVTGTFWLEFMHKVINLFLIVLYALGWLNFSWFFMGYLISMSLPVIPVILVLLRRGHFNLKPRLSFIGKPLRREIGSTMLFGFINGVAAVITFNIDRVFVNQYLSLSEVGIFGVCSLYATLIRIPYISISRIATGVIAEAWKRDDRDQIGEIYRKAALNQAIIGTLVFVGLLVNMDHVFEILPPEYKSGKWVLIIYSAGMLVNTIFGLAANITETSRYFRFTTLFLGLSVFIQLGLSILLIPRFGITGAAMATTATLILNSLFQAALQKFAFGISGVTPEILLVGVAGLVATVLGVLVPRLPLILDIGIRSAWVTLVFMGLIVFLKVSPDWNNLLRSKTRQLLSLFKPTAKP